MKKIKILSLFVCLIALLAACEDEDITPSYGARTVLVYIAGNNSLGQSDFDSKDVSEMIEGMKGTEGTTNNLLVYFAGYKKTAKLIRLIKNGKGEVKQETVMSYDKHNSVIPARAVPCNCGLSSGIRYTRTRCIPLPWLPDSHVHIRLKPLKHPVCLSISRTVFQTRCSPVA